LEPIKPKKIAFLVETAAAPVVALLVLGAGGGAVCAVLGRPFWAALAAVAGLGLAAAVLAAAHVAWRKERYTFTETQIIRDGGGVFSDTHVELNAPRITHVRKVLPWPRHPLFGVGTVEIDSAGSGEQIRLRALDDPEGVAKCVADLMRANGFSLAYGERLYKEQPPGRAIVLDAGGNALGGLFLLLFFLGPFIGAIGGAVSGMFGGAVGAALVLLALGAVAAHVVLRALDLRRRTYTVYDDGVCYEEGFLTRRSAFIPAENLADAETQQSLWDRIFSLYDVRVSCQGGRGDITFRRLGEGPALNQALEGLAERGFAKSAPKEGAAVAAGAASAAASAAEESPAAVDAKEAPAEAPRAAEETSAHRMHAPRALAAYGVGAVGLVLLLVLGSAVLGVAGFSLTALLGGNLFLVVLLVLGAGSSAVRNLIAIWGTRYELRPRSVKHIYRVFQSQETEFGNEKLTGIAYREGPLDRHFETAGLGFWSIGAAQPLTMQHVQGAAGLLPRAIRQAGMDPDAETRFEMPCAWSLRASLGESLPFLIFIAVAVPALAVAAALVSPWFWIGPAVLLVPWAAALAWEPIYYGRCGVRFFPSHLEIRKGVLWRQRYYARYDQIKQLTTTRFPLGEGRGRVTFRVAGQGLHTQITLGFVPDIPGKEVLLDRVLTGAAPPERLGASDAAAQTEAPVLLSRPALANSLVVLIAASVFLVPLLALLPITVPWWIAAVRRRVYWIESDRVAAGWGILFWSQRSVVHQKIDHIENARGALNNLFGNGNVQVFTAGSSSADWEAHNLPDYQAFYEQLQQQYG
jgi:uncharacterized membrane protein YdbT with pleckstrin-like domain